VVKVIANRDGLLTLVDAQRIYKVSRDILGGRLRCRGYKARGQLQSKRSHPPKLYRIEDIEDVVYNLADRWMCASGAEHVEISKERVKCPVCGRRDYGSNVRNGWCLECWCREFNRRNPIVKDLVELRKLWKANNQAIGRDEITRGEL